MMTFSLSCSDVDECKEVPGTCDHGFCENTVGGHICTCEVGFQQNADKTACIDVDECENPDTCRHGECKNMMGMYKCSCNESLGYKANPAETACMGKDFECSFLIIISKKYSEV